MEGAGHYLLPGLTDCHVHVRDQRELLSYLTHGVTPLEDVRDASAIDGVVLRGRWLATTELQRARDAGGAMRAFVPRTASRRKTAASSTGRTPP